MIYISYVLDSYIVLPILKKVSCLLEKNDFFSNKVDLSVVK